ncbi:MAG: M56 family metallopeptidase [Steroidobacteraceae bacterium]
MIALLAGAAARSLVLGLLVWLALAVLRPRNSHVRKTVWTVVLAASLAMPLLLWLAPAVSIHAPMSGATPLHVLMLGAAGTQETSAVPDAVWLGLSAIYLLVASVLSYRFARGLLAMCRTRREASALVRRESALLGPCWSRGLDVRSSTELSSPATFASTILLPARFAAWSEHKLAAVLAHERSHVREKDCYVLWLARIHCCLFWFNPLAWWLLEHLSGLAEATSDDAALEILRDRMLYAEILLELARERSDDSAAIAMARGATISARIERLLSGIAPGPRPTLRQRAFAAMILLPAISAAAIPVMPTHIAAGPQSSRDMPRVLSWPVPADLQKYYPSAARTQGVDGLVQIAVTLDREGRATDTLILSENPPNLGFGAAASTLAHLMRYGNPTGQQARIVFDVKFALGEHSARVPRRHSHRRLAYGG